MDNTKLNFEIKRKMFHLCSIVFPVYYIAVSKITMCAILTIITAFTVFLDISRNYDNKIKGAIDKILGKFLRPKEASGNKVLSGSSYMAFGFLLSCVLFPKGLAITSWLILIISDSFAAIIGIKFGSPLFNGKSYEGFVAFFLSALVISIISYYVIGFSSTFFIMVVSSFLTSVTEFFSEKIRVNDNLSIPLIYALSTTILQFILLPA